MFINDLVKDLCAKCRPSLTRPFRSSDHSHYLHPPSQSSPLASSPSDIADPSPISTSSDSTDTTHIDDTELQPEESESTPQPTAALDASNQDGEEPPSQKPAESSQPGERVDRVSLQLETKNAAEDALRPRSDEDEQPSSVIHAPQGFEAFVSDPSITSQWYA